MTNKDVYIAKMKLQLDELDGQMSALEARPRKPRKTPARSTRKKWPNCMTNPSWPRASSTA